MDPVAQRRIAHLRQEGTVCAYAALASMFIAVYSGMALALPCHPQGDCANNDDNSFGGTFYRNSEKIFVSSLAGTFHFWSHVYRTEKEIKKIMNEE